MKASTKPKFTKPIYWILAALIIGGIILYVIVPPDDNAQNTAPGRDAVNQSNNITNVQPDVRLPDLQEQDRSEHDQHIVLPRKPALYNDLERASIWCDEFPEKIGCTGLIDWIQQMNSEQRNITTAQLTNLILLVEDIQTTDLSDMDIQYMNSMPLQRLLSQPPELLLDTDRKQLATELERIFEQARHSPESDIMPLQMQWISALLTVEDTNSYLQALIEITSREQERNN